MEKNVLNLSLPVWYAEYALQAKSLRKYFFTQRVVNPGTSYPMTQSRKLKLMYSRRFEGRDYTKSDLDIHII